MLVNHAWPFDVEYNVKLFDAHIENIVDDTPYLEYLQTRMQEAYEQNIRIS